MDEVLWHSNNRLESHPCDSKFGRILSSHVHISPSWDRGACRGYILIPSPSNCCRIRQRIRGEKDKKKKRDVCNMCGDLTNSARVRAGSRADVIFRVGFSFHTWHFFSPPPTTHPPTPTPDIHTYVFFVFRR